MCTAPNSQGRGPSTPLSLLVGYVLVGRLVWYEAGLTVGRSDRRVSRPGAGRTSPSRSRWPQSRRALWRGCRTPIEGRIVGRPSSGRQRETGVVLGWQPTAAGGLRAPGSAPCRRKRCCRRQLMREASSGRLPHVCSCPSCSTTRPVSGDTSPLCPPPCHPVWLRSSYLCGGVQLPRHRPSVLCL